MKVARIAGIGLVSAAVAAGTAFDVRRPPRQIPRHGEYFVLQGDFHVHAALGDGGVAPWELRREAARRGLDVIAVTNHNQLLAARSTLSQSGGLPIVLVGQEITAPGFHMTAVGINQTIDWRLTASEAIRAVHDQGGVAIAAHPMPGSWTTKDDEALRLMDGAEVAHPGVIRASRAQRLLLDFHRRAAESNPSLAAIGSSDFHWGGHLGQCRTFLFVRDVSAAGVIDAVRDARTVAFDGDDRLIGDPQLVAAARAILKASPPAIATDARSRFAAWLALAGLAVLVIFG
jgi:predicted metal-dependent phosphoesterase TrpH